MPMNPMSAAFLAVMAGCAPRYVHKGPLAPADLWTPLPVQRTQVDGVDLAFMDSGAVAGSDLPPVVLVHGLSASMGFWEYQVPALQAQRRVLALDLPGFGASGRPDAPYTPPWFGDIVLDWLDGLGVDQAVFVGHSMGGQVALHIALDHPERVDRLVLAAPAGLESFGPGAARWLKDWWTEDRALQSAEAEIRTAFSTQVFNRMDPGVERLIEERTRMGLHPDFRGTSVAVSRSIAGMLDHPVAHRLGEIQAPTLLVFGTQDRMIPNPFFTGGRTRAVAEAGQLAIVGSQLQMIPGAGHTVFHDAPDAFNDALLGFLGAP